PFTPRGEARAEDQSRRRRGPRWPQPPPPRKAAHVRLPIPRPRPGRPRSPKREQTPGSTRPTGSCHGARRTPEQPEAPTLRGQWTASERTHQKGSTSFLLLLASFPATALARALAVLLGLGLLLGLGAAGDTDLRGLADDGAVLGGEGCWHR